ncbi:ATP-binding cassette domain-containing protein, partial [Vibrio parahaemolyticus]|nr:ATP-binding cassette domain-containing protein [Vibrio parahaemolyticus]
MAEKLIELKNISKQFPGVLANSNVNLTINKGEIHAIIGENGAGKTTLMNILYGLYEPTQGEIFIDGKKAVIKSPLDAIKQGIG